MSQSQSLGPCSRTGYLAPICCRPTSANRSQLPAYLHSIPVHYSPNSRRGASHVLRMTDWIFAGHRTNLGLLFLTDELARCGIHICDQLRVVAAGAIDHMPDEIIFATVPVKNVCDRRIPDF